MAELKDKVSDALSETRTLILGAEILLGFQLEATTASHRIVAGGEDRADVDRVGSRLMLASLLPLAFRHCGEFYVVAAGIGYVRGGALATAVLAFLAFMGFWFGYPLLRHARQEARSGYGGTRDDARQQF